MIAPDLIEDLKIISRGEAEAHDLSESVQSMFKVDGTDVTRRMVKLIEHERMKFKYLADISHEITFEYVALPEMIKLSDWSAESLRLPSSIVNPLENNDWCKIFPPEHFKELLGDIRATTPQKEVVTRQFVLNTGSGERWNKVIAKAMWSEDEPPQLEGAICKIIDVNDTTVTLKQLERRAEHDALSGLFNHDAARRRVQKLLSAKMGSKYALLLFDIDDFKQANDKFGHLFGDSVIETVADRIRKNTRNTDIAARLGGDEFMIFMEYGGTDIKPLVDRIFRKLMGDYRDFNIRVSMGVACAEDDGCDFDTLLGQADAAMYSVKKNKKDDYAFYRKGMKLGEVRSFTLKDHKEGEDV
ncbi:MAG: GGDEF domain-containing protein [Clostridiales bacterium]|nr:GGDEF domain-containing protein [Clostridiales bacterium]